MKFKDKNAVIIGGNSGIGLAAAQRLAAEGARIIIAGRDKKTLKEAQQATGALLAEQCDISRLDDLDSLYAKIKAMVDHIDVLIVNAGTGTFTPVMEITPEMWDQIHDVNLKGCFFAAQKGIPLMDKGGSIVFTGSVAAVMGLSGNVIYGSTKAGLRQVTRCMATELVAEGIRVNMVSPGPTDTPILTRSGTSSPEEEAALREYMSGIVPMKRMGDPNEVANAIVFLASDEASFISGVNLFADGGCVELG